VLRWHAYAVSLAGEPRLVVVDVAAALALDLVERLARVGRSEEQPELGAGRDEAGEYPRPACGSPPS
jgi:hypothetical protein